MEVTDAPALTALGDQHGEARRKLVRFPVCGAGKLVHASKQNGRIGNNKCGVVAEDDPARHVVFDRLEVGINILSLRCELGTHGAEKNRIRRKIA